MGQLLEWEVSLGWQGDVHIVLLIWEKRLSTELLIPRAPSLFHTGVTSLLTSILSSCLKGRPIEIHMFLQKLPQLCLPVLSLRSWPHYDNWSQSLSWLIQSHPTRCSLEVQDSQVITKPTPLADSILYPSLCLKPPKLKGYKQQKPHTFTLFLWTSPSPNLSSLYAHRLSHCPLKWELLSFPDP